MSATGLVEIEAAEGGLEFFPPPAAGDWFVIHTKSRHEKLLADTLGVMGIAHYLPLVRQARFYGRRKAMVDLPLFPSYLFVRGGLEHVYEADRTKYVANIIRVANQDKIDWELRNLFLALTNGAPLDPYAYLKAGMRVEVRSGPFRGLQGLIESRKNNGRLVLQVETLGRAVSLEIDGSLLDVIEEEVAAW